jgi:uncharacterized protein (TIGR02145 family)
MWRSTPKSAKIRGSWRCEREYNNNRRLRRKWRFLPKNGNFGRFEGDTRSVLVLVAINLNYENEDSFCFEYEEENCERYGRLYPWESAQLACPDGWHMPSPEEFNTLIDLVGGKAVAGARLKSMEGWETGAVSTDDYGFTALPAGRRGYYHDFTDKTLGAYFWSNSRVQNSTAAYNMDLRFDSDSAMVRNNPDAHDGNSVRCIRD